MIRNPITPAVAGLLSILSPGEAASIERVRSMDWRALELAGERVEIEWRCGKTAEIERANKLAAAANDIVIDLPGAIVANLAIRFADDRLRVSAVLIDDDG